ncbi:MAG: hypothetical protein FJ121_13675 [Deltaproteobacteria bacterium]|nr:hypothetical protein [Deltaproteobacteria bacterium]
MNDVTVKGWVLRETPSGMGVVFMAVNRGFAQEEVVLPKSQIAVVKGVMYVDRGFDRTYAACMADRHEARQKKKEKRCDQA